MPNPPIAKREAFSYSRHGITVEDPYHWLKDADYPVVDDQDVLNYLHAENAYFDAYMQPLNSDTDTIFDELIGRIEPKDWSVPLKDGQYFYQTRFAPGSEYPVHVRWRADNEEPDPTAVEILVDEPELAGDKDYFVVHSVIVSPDDRLVAYSTDADGSERYVIHIKDIATGEVLDQAVDDGYGPLVWASDSKSFYYVVADENWRPSEIRRHVVATAKTADPTIFEETDPRYFLSMSESTSRKFLLISSGNSESTETHFLRLGDATPELSLIAARRTDHLYSVDHHRDRFVIRSNRSHINFSVFTTATSTPAEAHWGSILDGTDDLYIEYFTSFENVVVVRVRIAGLSQILLLDEDDSAHQIEFQEPTYTVHIGSNAGPSVEHLRLDYSSLTTPWTTLDYDLESGTRVTKKVQVIPSGYDATLYGSKRLTIRARDGAEVPVSVVYNKELLNDQGNPLYLYAYGAYGHAIDPSFSTSMLSLLNRGFIYAIAHIRGGDDLGFQWYLDGKLQKRTNTFHDFVDVAKALVDKGFTTAGNIAIAGGSAGGSLMGAATNEAPELWGAVVSHVPFVDILNTMLDDSLPLTPVEWVEWGNPITDKTAFEYIRSYSPYDQLEPGAFPPILVTAGLNDPRVTYWEPAKYVAKLRSLKSDTNSLLLKTEMEAGHQGKTGRETELRERAEEFAFILNELAIPVQTPGT